MFAEGPPLANLLEEALAKLLTLLLDLCLVLQLYGSERMPPINGDSE
jgi:hypothetical protein